MKSFLYSLVATVAAMAVLAAPILSWPSDWRPLPKTATAILEVSGVSTSELGKTPPVPHDHDHPDESIALTGQRGSQLAITAATFVGQVSHESLESSSGESRLTILTPKISTDAYDLVAVSWSGQYHPTTRIHVRVKENDVWSGWHPLEDGLAHAPDPDSVESANTNRVTEPLMVADANGVQIRVDSLEELALETAQVVLISAEQGVTDGAPRANAFSAANAVAMPAVISRSQWGADESRRKSDVEMGSTIRAAFVHHTATTNNYTPEQAPQQVRALYRYFTEVRGYSDMGYNFVVDRFGRVYEGRAGSLDTPIVGAHTLGFNRDTFAISALGNFQNYRFTPAEAEVMIESIASVLVGKLAPYNRDPQGLVNLMSSQPPSVKGAAKTSLVTAPVISGHRDVLSTACPGTHLSNLLPLIRERTSAKLGAAVFDPVAEPAGFDYAGAGTIYRTRSNQALNWALQVIDNCGNVVRAFSGSQPDAGQLDIGWDARDDAGNPVPPGRYQLVLSGTGASGPFLSGSAIAVVNPIEGAPADPCPPATAVVPGAFDLVGAGFGHGVGMSQYGALGQARAGVSSAAILAHYYPGATLATAQVDVPIRVSLANGSGSYAFRGEAVDSGGGNLAIAIDGAETVVPPGEIVRVRNDSGAVLVTRGGGAGSDSVVGRGATVIVRWGGSKDPGQAGGVATVVNATQVTDATVANRLNSVGHRYRYGTLEVTPVANSQVRVINTLALGDEYVLGVAEMPSSWPAAALEAQAVASRSFALAKYGNGRVSSDCACHVRDGVSDQVFVGWNKEKSASGGAWRQSVMATMSGGGASGSAGTGVGQGLVLTQNGKPVTAYFHSSSGGRTQDPAEVWGSSVGFTSVVDDPWALDSSINPYASWTASVAQQRVAQVFGLVAVSVLEVISRTASGAAKEIRATAPTGATAVISGAAARSAFGLRSTHVNAIGPSGSVVNAVVQPGFKPSPTGANPPTAPAVAPQASLTLQTQTSAALKVGSQVKLAGVISPTQSRVTVLRQRKVGKKWQAVGKARTNATGEYRMAFKLPEKGTYVYRTVVLNKRKRISKVSEEITITAGIRTAKAPSCKAGGCECPTCAGAKALPVGKNTS